MVTWESDHVADEDFETFVQRLDAAGTQIGTNDIRISDMGFDADDPEIAYNTETNQFLVVWEGEDDTGALVDDEDEIFGQRLTNEGAEIGPNDFRISDMGPDGNADFDATEPDVAYNGRSNEFAVAWEGDDNTPPLIDNEDEIFVQRLNADGAEIGPNDARVSDMGPDTNADFDAEDPKVAANFRSNEWLVAWNGDDTTDGEEEIFGQRLDANGAATGTNDFRISQMGPDTDPAFDAEDVGIAYGGAPNEYLAVWEADDNSGALVDGEFEIYARRTGSAPPVAVQAANCRTVQATVAPPGDPSKVTLSRTQLLINQRISQAAVRRANAVDDWFEQGVEQRDVCGGAMTQAEMGPGVQTGFLPDFTAPGTATPRPVTPLPIGGGNPNAVQLTTQQLLVNQRISQAAVRRANALKARLDAGLTGGDIKDGQLTKDALQFGLGLLVADPTPNPPAKTTTNVPPPTRGNPGAIRLTAAQLLINQRISQAAVKRTNALRDRLGAGLSATDIQDASVTAVDFSPSVRP